MWLLGGRMPTAGEKRKKCICCDSPDIIGPRMAVKAILLGMQLSSITAYLVSFFAGLQRN
jgi:hypothetical protein